MNRWITAGMAALTLAGTTLSTATPAAAEGWREGGWRHYEGGGDDAGVAIAGGLVGLALGAAIAGGGSHYYDGGPYYGPGYGPGYGVCTGRRTIWDPYMGRYIVRYYRYAC